MILSSARKRVYDRTTCALRSLNWITSRFTQRLYDQPSSFFRRSNRSMGLVPGLS